MKHHLLGGLTLKALTRKVWHAANEDDSFGSAAKLSYYFLLALFPMLIFLTSLIGFLPGVQQKILLTLAEVAPGEAIELVMDTLNDVVSKRSGGLLSFGVLGALWAASSGMSAAMDALNVAYQAPSARSFWKQRSMALGLTMMLLLLATMGTVLIMFGDRLSAAVASRLGFGAVFAAVWRWVDNLLGLLLLLLGLGVLYGFGPNVAQKWRWITPGAVFAAVGMIAVSLLFSFYLRVGPGYSATYGSLGAVIVLMLWLYLMGLVLLIGGEINCEIERAARQPRARQMTARPAATRRPSRPTRQDRRPNLE